MDDTEEIRRKIARLINERGLNFAKVSLSLGKNIAYIQQFIKNGSPRRLGEVERQKLARLLKVDEQELTDLPLKVSSGFAPTVNQDVLCLVIENVESCDIVCILCLGGAVFFDRNRKRYRAVIGVVIKHH